MNDSLFGQAGRIEKLRERHVRQRLAALQRRREHQSRVVPQRPGSLQRLERYVGGVRLDEPVRLAPAESRAYALPELAGDFGLLRPQRSQDGRHVFATDLVHRHIAEPREDVALHLLQPVCGNYFAAPPWPVRLERQLGCFAECRLPGPALLPERVSASPDQSPVLEGLVAGLSQTDERESAQADVAAFSVNRDSLDPALGAPRCHVQIERRVGPVHAGLLERLRLRGREPIHAFPTFPHGSIGVL